MGFPAAEGLRHMYSTLRHACIPTRAAAGKQEANMRCTTASLLQEGVKSRLTQYELTTFDASSHTVWLRMLSAACPAALHSHRLPVLAGISPGL